MRLRVILFGLAIIGGIALTGYIESGSLHAPSTPEVARGSASLEDAVRAIAVGTRTSPLVGDQPRRGMPTLTFLAQADGKDIPRIVSDATGWGERADGTMDYAVGRMTRVGQTSWYALEVKVEPYARIEYLITYGAGDFRLDPHNPRKVMRVGGLASEVVMPGYVPPQEFVDPPIDGGRITDTMVESRVLNDAREVIVYTPPNYKTDGAYPLAVFEDGALMVNSGEAPRVLNWLIAHQAIEPIVAVFVEPKSRADDFRRGAPMQRFVADELLPWVAERYRVTKDANRRAIIGVSAGARAALNTATASPTTFGLIGLLIPALDTADIETVPSRDRLRLRVSIVAARYDALNRAAARSVQLNVSDQGHVAEFIEVPEGHSTATWRTHLRTVLIGLFGVQKKGN